MKEVLTTNQRCLIKKLKQTLAYLDFEKDTKFYIKKHYGVWAIVEYTLFGDGITLDITLSRSRDKEKIKAFAKYSDIIMSPSDIFSTKITHAMDILCIKGL